MPAQLSLFEALETGGAGRPTLATGGEGAARLMRALVREGLEEDAMPTAAVLVLALDREAPTT
jgi:hypothetical protein